MKKFIYLIITILFSLSLHAQDIIVVNRCGFDIYSLYISPESGDWWSDNLIEYDIIASDDYFIVNVDWAESGELFTLKAFDSSGESYLVFHIEPEVQNKVVLTIDDLSYLQPQAGSMEITVINGSFGDIVELYISDETASEWGEELLQGRSIYLGESLDIIFLTEGFTSNYDIKFALSNDSERYFILSSQYIAPHSRIVLKNE